MLCYCMHYSLFLQNKTKTQTKSNEKRMQEENFLHEWHKVYICNFTLEQGQPYKVLHLNPLLIYNCVLL